MTLIIIKVKTTMNIILMPVVKAQVFTDVRKSEKFIDISSSIFFGIQIRLEFKWNGIFLFINFELLNVCR